MSAEKTIELIPGHDATGPEGANHNAAIGNEATDLISGSVLHRSCLCEISRIAGTEWASAPARPFLAGRRRGRIV